MRRHRGFLCKWLASGAGVRTPTCVLLPNHGPVGGLANHLVALLAAKGLLKLRHVHQRPDGAVLAGRVRGCPDLSGSAIGSSLLR